jgi:hypothetical protein
MIRIQKVSYFLIEIVSIGILPLKIPNNEKLHKYRQLIKRE